MEEVCYRLSLMLGQVEQDWVEPLEDGAAKAALRRAIINAAETARTMSGKR